MTPKMTQEQLFYSSYELNDLIGQGTSGCVYRCTRRIDGQQFAVKIVTVSSDNPIFLDGLTHRETLLREIQTLEKVTGHRNIVELIEAFDMETCFVLVFELCLDGDLHSFMDKKPVVPEEAAFHILKQIVAALEHCHSMGIVHRDVKPKNILIDEDLNVKLTDFGFATELRRGEHLTELCGTPGYLAPEMLLSTVYSDVHEGYSFQVDSFACGVILYEMLRGFKPFEAYDWHEYAQQVINGPYYSMDTPEWDEVVEDAKYLVSKLLEIVPLHNLSCSWKTLLKSL